MPMKKCLIKWSSAVFTVFSSITCTKTSKRMLNPVQIKIVGSLCLVVLWKHMTDPATLITKRYKAKLHEQKAAKTQRPIKDSLNQIKD